MENKRKIKWLNIVIFLIIICGLVFLTLFFLYNKKQQVEIKKEEMFLSSTTSTIQLFDEELQKAKEVVRGTNVLVTKEDLSSEEEYIKIEMEKDEYYVLKDSLVEDILDVVKEDKIYVRTPSTLYEDLESGKINGIAEKGDELDVIGYDSLLEDGTVSAYKVISDEIESYIYKKYIVFNEEESLLNYEPEKYYDIHNSRSDIYSKVGGNGGSLDYYPVYKEIFEDNIMPQNVYALYLNDGRNVIGNIDAYIEFAKTTKINAFVVDIKDNEAPGYKSKVFEEYSPTNYKYANNSFEDYKNAIKKIKDAGFYVIGRITTFKDNYFVKDHPEVAIIDNRTNKPFDNGTWPSAFNRFVWEYNVNLAKEAVIEMGFNEIQFDYVRFPDRTVSQERAGYLDFQNEYDEEKVQAIQRFLMYACDELHKLNVYVSADVFGESVNTYITAYGQYWPAISNVVDVISGMPYPDHFSTGSYGISVPWEEPYRLMNRWGEDAYERQQEIPTPAIARTWILAQNTMKGYAYNSSHIEAQINGLYDANLTGGYMTWASSSSLAGYKNRSNAYSKEY
jgi:hypothetical protein